MLFYQVEMNRVSMNQTDRRKMSTYGKARVIAASREIVRSQCGPMWSIESENSPGHFYKVVYLDEEVICDCPAFEYGMIDTCKHILSVTLLGTGVY
jgi:SWIM zinc finger